MQISFTHGIDVANKSSTVSVNIFFLQMYIVVKGKSSKHRYK